MNNSCAFVDPSYENFLMHYGKLGQRKGVRNYENYDGTLTPEGKERYSIYWKNGTNLKGKKVNYDDSTPKKAAKKSEPTGIREALNIGTARYEKPDGSLTAEGKRKFGDILTKKEMENLVRNYNKTNGTKYKVGEVTFRKNGKLYTPEGKRIDEKTELDPVGLARVKNKLFGNGEGKPKLLEKITDTKYKQEVRNMKNLSDADLQKAIERARLEQTYMNTLDIQKSAGEKFLDNLKNNTASVASDLAKDFAREAGSVFLNQVVKPKIQEATGLTFKEMNKVGDKYAQAKKDAQYEFDLLNAVKYRQEREGRLNKEQGKNQTENQNGGKQNQPQQPQQQQQKGQQQQTQQPNQSKPKEKQPQQEKMPQQPSKEEPKQESSKTSNEEKKSKEYSGGMKNDPDYTAWQMEYLQREFPDVFEKIKKQ